MKLPSFVGQDTEMDEFHWTIIHRSSSQNGWLFFHSSSVKHHRWTYSSVLSLEYPTQRVKVMPLRGAVCTPVEVILDMPIFILVPIAVLNYFIHKNLNWVSPLGKEQMTTIISSLWLMQLSSTG
jgi:hypothetical protein